MQKVNGHYTILIILLLAAVFGQFVGMAFYPLLPSMHKSMNVVHHVIQMVVPAYLLGFALTQILAGFLSDIFGRRGFILLGLLVSSLSAFLTAFAPNFIVLVIGFFGQAVGVGFVVPIENAIVRDVYDEKEESKIFGFVNIAIAVGGIIAPLSGGLIGFFLGWRWLFAFLGAFGIVMFLISYKLLGETYSQTQQEKFSFALVYRTAKKLFANKLFRNSTIVLGLCYATQAAFNTAAPFLMHFLFHLTSHTIGLLLMMPSIALIVGLGLAELFNRYLSYQLLILLGVGVVCLGSSSMLILSYVHFNSVLVLMVPIIIIYLGLGIATPSFWATALSSFSKVVAVAASFLIFFQNILAIVASSGTAYLHETNAMPLAFVLMVFAFLALIAHLFLPRATVSSAN